MTYSISSISNRDLQILYHYRILRQPSNFLKAVYTNGPSEALVFQPAGTEETDEGTLYLFQTTTKFGTKVPLLEFGGEESAWAVVQDLVSLDVTGNYLTLRATVDSIEGLEVTVYWVDTPQQLTKLLEGYALELKGLATDLENIKAIVDGLSDTSNFLKLPTGIPGNLVKLKKADSGLMDLADAEYHIVDAVPSQTLFDPTEEELASMIREIDGDITIKMSGSLTRTLQGFWGNGTITITGDGTWYIVDVTNDICFVDFRGTVFVQNCPAVRLNRGVMAQQVTAINSFVVFALGTLKKVNLVRNSVLKHNSGNIEVLEHVGVGCEYYSQVRNGNGIEPKFSWDQIQGTVCLGDGQIIINGRDISFVTGQYDPPMQPSKLHITITGDPSKDDAEEEQDPDPTPGGDRDPIAGNTPEIKIYNWLLVNTTLTKPAICGALGNFKQESGYDPFIHGAYYGLWQTNRQGLRDLYASNGLSSYWHTGGPWSSWEGHVTEEEWDLAIQLNLSYLAVDTNWNADGFSYYYYDECLDKPTYQEGSHGAESYAELFCAMIERCVGGSDAILDPGVANFIKNSLYGGTSYLYQELEERRTYASQSYESLVGD